MLIKMPKARRRHIRPNIDLSAMLDIPSLQKYMERAPNTARYPILPQSPESELMYLTSALAIEVVELMETIEELDYGDAQMVNEVVVLDTDRTLEEIGDILWYGVLLLRHIGLDHTTPEDDLRRCLGGLDVEVCSISMSDATMLTALPRAAATMQEIGVKAFRDMHLLENKAQYTEKLNDLIRHGVIITLAWCYVLADRVDVALSDICDSNTKKLLERSA